MSNSCILHATNYGSGEIRQHLFSLHLFSSLAFSSPSLSFKRLAFVFSLTQSLLQIHLRVKVKAELNALSLSFPHLSQSLDMLDSLLLFLLPLLFTGHRASHCLAVSFSISICNWITSWTSASDQHLYSLIYRPVSSLTEISWMLRVAKWPLSR